MSGGSYDYAYCKLEMLAGSIREEGGCGAEYSRPALRRALKAHIYKLANAMRAVEWNDSCDGDDTEIAKLEELLGPGAELVEALAQAKRDRDELNAAIDRAEKAVPL